MRARRCEVLGERHVTNLPAGRRMATNVRRRLVGIPHACPCSRRLVGVIAAVLLLTLVTIGVVRARAAPRALDLGAVRPLMKSGTLAGIANDLVGRSGPAHDQPRTAAGVLPQRRQLHHLPTVNATTHLLGQSSACRPTWTRRPFTGFATPSSGTTPARPRPPSPNGDACFRIFKRSARPTATRSRSSTRRPGRGHLVVRGEQRTSATPTRS